MIPKLDDKSIKRVQGIVGGLLFIALAVNNKLILALSANGAQKEATTKAKNAAVKQLLEYVATHPNDGLLFSSK